MVEMEVHQVQVSSRAYHRVLLRAKKGEGNLHIVIGPSEARAISLAHCGQKAQRPLSYDMARALLEEAGASIRQVAITSLQDGIYYAEIRLTDDEGRELVVDSRPSDAIALALRAGAPIFADEDVLEDGRGELGRGGRHPAGQGGGRRPSGWHGQSPGSPGRRRA